MKRLSLALLLLVLAVWPVWAQPVTVVGPAPTPGNCTKFFSTTQIADAGFTCGAVAGLTIGTTTISGGSNGAVLYNNSSVLGNLLPTSLIDTLCSTNGDFLIRLTGTWQCGSLGVTLLLSGSVLSAGPGIDANILNVQSGNYTIANTDCGSTIFYGSVGQFTLTLPSVSGFPANCSVLVKNGDTINGKILSGFPSSLGTLLYPRQNFGVKIVNGNWTPFYYPAPFAPISAVTFFVSPSGVDTNDGLTTGTPITLATACQRRQTIFQPGAVTVKLADGTYSTAVSGVLCSVLGNSGGNSQTLTNITGNCTTPGNVILSIPDGDTAIQVKDLGEVEIGCMQFQGAGSATIVGISAGQFSVVDLQSTIWNISNSGSIDISIAQASSLNLIGTAAMTILAAPTSGTVISLSSSANMSAGSGTTIAIPSAIAWGAQFLQLYGPVTASIGGMTFTGSGVAGTTGKRASLIGPAWLITNAVACNTFFPGNGACTLVNGAQDDAGDNPTSTTPVGGVSCPSGITAGTVTVVNGVVTHC